MKRFHHCVLAPAEGFRRIRVKNVGRGRRRFQLHGGPTRPRGSFEIHKVLYPADEWTAARAGEHCARTFGTPIRFETGNPDELDEKTRVWLRDLVNQFGGDKERAARWLSRLPGLGLGIRKARDVIAAAFDDSGRSANPDLLEEIARLREKILTDGKRMTELLERVAREQRAERAKAKATDRRSRKRRVQFLRQARRQERNPDADPGDVQEAVSMYEQFTGQPAGTAQLLEVPEPGDATVVLGELAEVSYVTGKRGGGKVEYVHRFGRPRPKLLADPSGKSLFIAGGKFKVNDRGIVG